MKIKVKEVTKTVPLLVDPEPGWMSLVSHGANQEPWHSLKSNDGKRQENKMGIKSSKKATQKARLTRMNFSKEQFPDEAAVEAFLTEKGITGCDVVDEEDIFAAVSNTNDDVKLEKAVQQRTKFAGVTMFVAAIKEDAAADETDEGEDGEDDDTTASDDDGDDDEPKEDVTAKGATKAKTVDGEKAKKTIKGKKPAAKADDEAEADDADHDMGDTQLRFPSAKYDWWAGYMSQDGNLYGVLKDGIDYDGLPPGVDEVMSAVYTTAGNILSASDDAATKKAKLAQVGEDFAAITFGLFELFEKATEDATKSANGERREKAAAYVESFRDSVTRAAKGEFGPGNTNNAVPSTKGKDENVITAKGGVTVDIADLSDEDENPGMAALETLISKAVNAAVAPVKDGLAKLRKSQRETDEALNRSSLRRNDASAIDALAPDNDDDEEDETENVAKANLDNFAEAMGVRKRSNG